MEKTKYLSVRVTPKMFNALTECCEKNELNKGLVVRMALREYLIAKGFLKAIKSGKP